MGYYLALGALLAPLQLGRQIESWPYEKLFEKADLVVIGKALSKIDGAGKIHDKLPDPILKPVLTTIQVVHFVKGKLRDKELVIVHYRVDEKLRGQLANGPLLIDFHREKTVISYPGVSVGLGPPEYMIFLKRRPDARYECVSGQIDPRLSVRQVIGPLAAPR